ncbi:hypothetical protein NEOLEDRAFT_1133700 [Neolentinus lepideus HHB14362 ss-1]|uniref:Uncharacterized protein n=1 Tax=Neolentinus lepideus HHB14362 ss-1 TaxID=1314782 RepID=A0A165SL93_9AGAM|nr:hypothetical protein NEOLEDRAFT_1133700 [Neolentinus lepideus HHB14362 ss-1]
MSTMHLFEHAFISNSLNVCHLHHGFHSAQLGDAHQLPGGTKVGAGSKLTSLISTLTAAASNSLNCVRSEYAA